VAARLSAVSHSKSGHVPLLRVEKIMDEQYFFNRPWGLLTSALSDRCIVIIVFRSRACEMAAGLRGSYFDTVLLVYFFAE